MIIFETSLADLENPVQFGTEILCCSESEPNLRTTEVEVRTLAVYIEYFLQRHFCKNQDGSGW